MIVFDLACECGLIFEGWFSDRDDFDRQEDEMMLICPGCGGSRVHKILSPVRSCAYANMNGEVAVPAGPTVSPEEQALEVLKVLQDYVLTNFDDVGSRLAEESLKMRYGLSKARNIRGVATEAEEKMLAGEGIELLKIPMPAKSEEDA